MTNEDKYMQSVMGLCYSRCIIWLKNKTFFLQCCSHQSTLLQLEVETWTLTRLVSDWKMSEDQWQTTTLCNDFLKSHHMSLQLLLCVVPYLLVFIYFPPLLKVVSRFLISMRKIRAAFSTRPLLCVINCAYGQHESYFWYKGTTLMKSTLFLLNLLKTASWVKARETAACTTPSLTVSDHKP